MPYLTRNLHQTISISKRWLVTATALPVLASVLFMAFVHWYTPAVIQSMAHQGIAIDHGRLALHVVFFFQHYRAFYALAAVSLLAWLAIFFTRTERQTRCLLLLILLSVALSFVVAVLAYFSASSHSLLLCANFGQFPWSDSCGL